MGKHYKFSLIQFESHPIRGERLNVGIAITDEKSFDVRITRRLTKLQAITAAANLDNLTEALSRLPEMRELLLEDSAFSPIDLNVELSKLGPCRLVSCGAFFTHSQAEYDTKVLDLFNQLVEPEKAPAPRPKRRATKVKREITNRLKKIGILGNPGDGLEHHRVVPNYPIAEGVEADLVLRNGAYHILETVDVTNEATSPRKIFSDIGFTTIVFEHAKMVYGEKQIVPRLIYQASAYSENLAAPALAAMEHQGIELINWQSAVQRNRLVEILANLAGSQMRSSAPDSWVDASTKSKLELN